MTLTLAAELALLAGWEVTGSRPAGWTQYLILAVAACAMGIRSAAAGQLGLGSVATTYLTGTLTGLVSAIFRADAKVGWRRPVLLAGLLAGASLAGLLVASAARAVPCLPLLGVIGATVLGARSVHSR